MTQSRQEPFALTNSQTMRDESLQEKLTLMQSFISGAVAGSAEVIAIHPLWSIKTRMQRLEPFTLNPNILYRGFMSNMFSMVPISALQVGLDRGIAKFCFASTGEISDYQRISTSFIAGIGSSLVSCPTEMIMTMQGKKSLGFYAATSYLIQEAGLKCLYNGWFATAKREGMFTSSYLGITPLFKKMYGPYIEDENKLKLASGLSAGICGSLVSQVADTIKSAQQDANPAQPINVFQAYKNIYEKHGLFGLFKGGLPRMGMVTAAVYIMGNVTEAVETRMSTYKK